MNIASLLALLAAIKRGGLKIASSATAASSTLQTSITCAKPDGTEEGNLLVAIMTHQGAAGAWTGDTGWNEVIDQASADPSLRAAWLLAGEAEPASYTFSISPDNRRSSVIILRIPGAVWDTIGTIAVRSGAGNLSPGGITAAGGLLIAAFGSVSAPSFTTPEGMAFVDQAAATSKISVFAQKIAAGATGARTSTVGSSGNHGAVLMAVKKAPA